jgi:hypothetical protein
MQSSSEKEMNQWVTAILTTLKRKDFEFPYVYFPIFKKNKKNVMQERCIQFDFMNKCIKNIHNNKIKRNFGFVQLESYERDKDNTYHINIKFKSYSHLYDIYLEYPLQVIFFLIILNNIKEDREKATIRKSIGTNEYPSVFAFEFLSEKIISKLKFSSSNLNKITLENEVGQLFKRWLIIQGGQLVIFSGDVSQFPLFVFLISNLIIEKVNENPKMMKLTFTNKINVAQKKYFEFSSKQVLEEWFIKLEHEKEKYKNIINCDLKNFGEIKKEFDEIVRIEEINNEKRNKRSGSYYFPVIKDKDKEKKKSASFGNLFFFLI